MKTPRPNSLFLIFSAAVFLLHLSLVPAVAKLTVPSPWPRRPTLEDIDYIHSSCQNTSYPDTCFNSIKKHATRVQQDPRRLAYFAVAKSFYEIQRMAGHVISHVAGYDAHIRALYDAVNQIRDSMTQMEKLIEYDSKGESLGFQINKVQTWMSAALTNIEDMICSDGFKDFSDDPWKLDVCNRATRVKEVTSNALTLVNNYANMIYQLRNEL